METKNLQWLLLGGIIGYIAYSFMKKNEDMTMDVGTIEPTEVPPTDILGGLPAPSLPPMPTDTATTDGTTTLPDTGTTPVTVSSGDSSTTTGTTTGTTITTTGTGTASTTTSFIGFKRATSNF